MIYRETPLLLVAILAAAAAFLSAAYGTYAALGLQHGIPLGWCYAEQPFHTPPPVTLLYFWVIAVALCITFAGFLIYPIGMTLSPSYGIIGHTSFALSATKSRWKHFWRFLFAAFCACSHYENVARNLA